MAARAFVRGGILVALALAAGCGRPVPPGGGIAGGPPATVVIPTAPTELPKPPLALAEPKPPPAVPGKSDKEFDVLDADELEGLARRAVGKVDYPAAVAAQYRAVQKGSYGLYNLACYYALVRDREAAFYWLQRAAAEDGVDPRHAAADTDLDDLRTDPRYAQVNTYLRGTTAYWRAHAKPVTLVYVPNGHDKTKPTPVLLCLHGRGSRPQGFFGDASQGLADELGCPVVCVSGTRPTGPRSFVWAVDPKADAQRLDDALKEAGDRLTPAPGKLLTIGFSEGAQVGLDVAARDPERYAGAIAMSPGADFLLGNTTPSAKVKDRRYVVTIGGAEHPGNVLLARQDRDWLTKAGAKVQHLTFPGVGHTLPPDFGKQFPKWVAFVLDGAK